MNSQIAQWLCMAWILAFCAGCSHESWTTIEETSRLPSVAAPILSPVSWVAMAGRALTSTSSESSDTDRGKQFVLSRRVMDEFSANGKFMEEVLAMQTRFRSHDFGGISTGQIQANTRFNRGKGSVGRYPSGNNGAAVIITDEGSEFKVRYEDETAE